MLKVGIIGATGYAGEELIKILLKHPKIKLTYLVAKIKKSVPINRIFPHLKSKIDLTCESRFSLAKGLKKADLFFLALPHRTSMEMAPGLLKEGKRVIDLSADYRLKDAALYKKWYGVTHKDKENLKKAVYGLPELYREKIRKADLVANPGCYPTGAVLALLPFLKQRLIDTQWIVIDSKSGVSGAGREALVVQEFHRGISNMKAYKVNEHQHSPEINQELSKVANETIGAIFTPHIVPMERGIVSTIYLRLKKKASNKKVIKLYKKFYEKEPFVKVLAEGNFPQTKDVVNTNSCHIGIKIDTKKKLGIIVAAIDNLLKGASGQAIQNMNIMYNFKEAEALI